MEFYYVRAFTHYDAVVTLSEHLDCPEDMIVSSDEEIVREGTYIFKQKAR